MSKKIAAFFDVDGTIFRNSLLIEHFKMLIKFGFFEETSFVGGVKNKFENWEKRRGSYDDYLDEVVESYISYMQNISCEDIDYVATRVIERKSEKIYTYSRHKIKEHIEKGDLVIIISGSPSFLVEKMAKKLGAHDYIGTIYHKDKNGYYNGKLEPMWDSESKIHAINDFVKKYDIDLEKSYAYGDTTGDYGMFTKVGFPVAINPAKRLFKKILKNQEMKNKIQIVVERKDMVYVLDGNVKYIDIKEK